MIATRLIVTLFFFFSFNVDAIHNFERLQSVSACNHTVSDYKTLCTGGIFATYPKEFLTLGTGFFDQVCLKLFSYSCIVTPHARARVEVIGLYVCRRRLFMLKLCLGKCHRVTLKLHVVHVGYIL